jgi:hypothetical protein
LMEQCRPEKGPEMITMFTVDGDHLIATHYCSASNQPQMATSPITDAQKPLEFSLVRVTGLKSPDDFHNTGLTVIRDNHDRLTQEWSYHHSTRPEVAFHLQGGSTSPKAMPTLAESAVSLLLSLHARPARSRLTLLRE